MRPFSPRRIKRFRPRGFIVPPSSRWRELQLPADQLAVAVNALGNGLLIARALRPEAVPDGLYGAVLLQLFESLRPFGWPRVDTRPSSPALSGAAQLARKPPAKATEHPSDP